jgi:hypothetical protein
VTLRQNILVGALFVAGFVLAHTAHRDLAVLVMAGACLVVLIVERGE